MNYCGGLTQVLSGHYHGNKALLSTSPCFRQHQWEVGNTRQTPRGVQHHDVRSPSQMTLVIQEWREPQPPRKCGVQESLYTTT